MKSLLHFIVLCAFVSGSLPAAMAQDAVAPPGTAPLKDAAPMTVTAAVERAIRQSNELRRREAQLAQARAQHAQAELLPNPVATYTREDLTADDRSYAEWSATLEYPLLALLARGPRVDAAERSMEATALRVSRHRATLRYQTQLDFLTLWAARRTLDAWRTLGDGVRRLSETAALRAAEGEISPYEEQRLRTELSRLQWRITEATEARRAAESALAFTLGLSSDSLARVPLVLPRPGSDSLHVAELVRIGLQRREDVQALQAEREATERRGTWLRRRWMEDITLGGGYKQQSDLFRGPVIALSLPLPLFDRDQGNTAATEAETTALTHELEGRKRQIEGDIRAAVSSYNALARQSRQMATLTPEEYDGMLAAATAAYTEGEFTLLQYVDAITAYMESAELDVRVRVALLRAAFTVAHVTGDATVPFYELP
ncbi:MAG: TolC family protein [Bacteroidota bacterium]|nr:TolC family protein [Bacteroidota bacterium]